MSRESGQAAVETAITLPLTLFLVLGTIQLFMMFQGRAMAQYAVARATRAASLKHGACDAMRDTAVAALLPTFTATRDPRELVQAWRRREGGRFSPAHDGGYSEDIVWIFRRLNPPIDPDEEEVFDLLRGPPKTISVRMVFWYPLEIPFANWVVSAIALGRFGLQNLQGANPLLVTQAEPNWMEPGSIDARVGQELLRRFNARHYAMPIEVSSSMRMMTPARARHFTSGPCPTF